ncbi:MAG TPA: trypsin-like peptidase domain-containing protein [Streptosporangiaceae bacterium]
MIVVERGICQVLRDDHVVGLGFAIDADHVVTCAHVVNTALGRPDKLDPGRPAPGDVIRVQFPIGNAPGGDTGRSASVVGWLPGSAADFKAGDIAVLKLAERAPEYVPGLRPRRHRPSMTVQMWGPQPNKPQGTHVTGKLMGEVAGGLIQINAGRGAFKVQRGFSGGPVWETASGEVVGVLTARGAEYNAVDAYLLAVDRVIAAWPQWQPRDPAEVEAGHRVADLQAKLREQFGAGQWQAVIDIDAELARLDPSASDPDGRTTRARAALAADDLDRRYNQALADQDNGNWAAAAHGYDEILQIDPGYRDAAARRERCRHGDQIAALQSRLKEQAGAGEWSQVLAIIKELTGLDATEIADPSLAEFAARARLEVAAHPPAPVRRLDDGSPVNAVAWHPDGRRVAVARNSAIARIYDISGKEPGGNLLLRTDGPSAWVHDVAFSGDGTRLVTATSYITVSLDADRDRGGAQVWDTTSGQRLSEIPTGGPVTAVAFSPDGNRLATCGTDNRIRIWDAANGEQLREVRHDGAVTAVAFSPDGDRLATGSQDGSARIWDGSGGRLLEVHHVGAVTAVAFSPDGNRLATGGQDGSARIWPVAGL